MNTTKNFIISGVGGQGVIRFSQILGDVLFEAGLDVKKAEVHGMSQRGGGVISHLRSGSKVFSPLIEKGTADYVIAMEKLEAFRVRKMAKKNGIVIASTFEVEPSMVKAGLDVYPENLEEELKKYFSNQIYLIPTLDIAKELGNLRLHNTILLGKLASKMEFEKDIWIHSIQKFLPEKFYELNKEAFARGYQYE